MLQSLPIMQALLAGTELWSPLQSRSQQVGHACLVLQAGQPIYLHGHFEPTCCMEMHTTPPAGYSCAYAYACALWATPAAIIGQMLQSVPIMQARLAAGTAESRYCTAGPSRVGMLVWCWAGQLICMCRWKSAETVCVRDECHRITTASQFLQFAPTIQTLLAGVAALVVQSKSQPDGLAWWRSRLT
jgi:hypothetical protein